MTNRAGTLVSNLSGEMAYESFRPAPLPPNPPIEVSGDYEQWISFFLQAFADSAEDAIHTIDRLTELHDKNLKIFDTLTKRQRTSVLKVFAYLESNPIIDIQKTATALEMSYNTVAKVVSILIDEGILEQTDKSGKTKIYSYTEYLNILRKDT